MTPLEFAICYIVALIVGVIIVSVLSEEDYKRSREMPFWVLSVTPVVASVVVFFLLFSIFPRR